MKIVLGNLKEDGDQLAAFLEPRIGAKPTLAGGELMIDDDSIRKGVKPQQVKTYVKRFLLKNDQRKLYKVMVEGKELTLVYLEEMEEEAEEEEKKEKKQAKVEEEEEEAEEPKKDEASEDGEEEAKDSTSA